MKDRRGTFAAVKTEFLASPWAKSIESSLGALSDSYQPVTKLLVVVRVHVLESCRMTSHSVGSTPLIDN